jgi:hypothetical protein
MLQWWRLREEVAMVTFGRTPTYQSDENIELNVSDDGRALTLGFSGGGPEVAVGSSKRGRLADWSPELLSPAPTATRAFFLGLPLEGYDERVEIEFFVSNGFVLTQEGTTATIMFSVNGQTAVTDFPANSDQSFTQQLNFTAAPTPSECRLCVFLLVGRDSTNPNAEAFLSTGPALDAEFLPRPS